MAYFHNPTDAIIHSHHKSDYSLAGIIFSELSILVLLCHYEEDFSPTW